MVMRSVPGAVATRSQSTHRSMLSRMATRSLPAPGTDLITLGPLCYRARLSSLPATIITMTIIAIRITP